MPTEDNKILKYNHGENSMKVPFIIYADIVSLPEKMRTCSEYNLEFQGSVRNLQKRAFFMKFYLAVIIIKRNCQQLK